MIQGIICGKGGQGVITLNAMIGTLASELGLSAVSAETHGMAMRGGSVATYIKIGECAGAAVAKGSADFIISLTKDEALRNLDYLKEGGLLIMDADGADGLDKYYKVRAVNATKTAKDKFGNGIYAGQILMGIFIGSFKELQPQKSMKIMESAPKINIDAVRYGAENA